jgi:hypothetical protein
VTVLLEKCWMHLKSGLRHVLKDTFPAFAIRYFPSDLAAVSNEHGEMFYQETSGTERSYRGKVDSRQNVGLLLGVGLRSSRYQL